MTHSSKKTRRSVAVIAALCLAVLAGPAASSAVAAAEPAEPSTIPFYEGGGFGTIAGPSDPEDFSWRIRMSADQTLRQVDETEAAVVYDNGVVSFTIRAELAHAADGATVPTTLRVSEGDVLTLTVHHRAGNPAAAGAPFAYPVTGGPGWQGGYSTVTVPGPPDLGDELAAIEARIRAANPPATIEVPPAPSAPAASAPVPVCTVPSLRGLSLRAAKARLRSADCAIGTVRLAHGVRVGAGEVVRQSSPAGSRRPSGASVAVKLGAG